MDPDPCSCVLHGRKDQEPHIVPLTGKEPGEENGFLITISFMVIDYLDRVLRVTRGSIVVGDLLYETDEKF